MIDDTDRKLLGLLEEDALQSYAALGEQLHLSAPAVHERVKKLRKNGVIKKTTIAIDGEKIGRGLLAFVHIDSEGWGKTEALMELSDLPEVEEIHSVAGDTCMLLKVRAADTKALENLLYHIYQLHGVKSTRSYVVLNTYLEHGPRP
ncbi:Lrp/AsnC family transcriptional regulator [Aestuariispira ectoiniformans]|uniref:Lrp/AsnC family transcriptional regulator n=1 Tax=Aestuariispira ectoiniformans TaxID=2775080 RepID=UPI00223B4671|nr:Lrp/AsnC family transcriptional regulator [Aestuariispira ectoiniformans]